VAAVSWWDPENTASAPVIDGFAVEAALPTNGTSCAGNRAIPGQVTRGFWDLDDANNEAGSPTPVGNDNDNDTRNYTSVALINNWDNFPSGTADRQDSENDANGVNIWDYTWNSWNTGGGWGSFENYETLVYHNCLDSQDLN
jgi:hypothetical protein